MRVRGLQGAVSCGPRALFFRSCSTLHVTPVNPVLILRKCSIALQANSQVGVSAGCPFTREGSVCMWERHGGLNFLSVQGFAQL